jgi:hypothetical protein
MVRGAGSRQYAGKEGGSALHSTFQVENSIRRTKRNGNSKINSDDVLVELLVAAAIFIRETHSIPSDEVVQGYAFQMIAWRFFQSPPATKYVLFVRIIIPVFSEGPPEIVTTRNEFLILSPSTPTSSK